MNQINHLQSTIVSNTIFEIGCIYNIQIYYPAYVADSNNSYDKDLPERFVDHLELELEEDSELSLSFKCLHYEATCQNITIAKDLISKVEFCRNPNLQY